VCCGTLSQEESGLYGEIACTDSSDCQSNSGYVFCTPSASILDPCTTLVGPGYTCEESSIIPGYYRCTNAGSSSGGGVGGTSSSGGAPG
jgi:hypothetical protein